MSSAALVLLTILGIAHGSGLVLPELLGADHCNGTGFGSCTLGFPDTAFEQEPGATNFVQVKAHLLQADLARHAGSVTAEFSDEKPKNRTRSRRRRHKSGYKLSGTVPDAEESERLLESRGKYLTFSRDAWILLILSLAGNLLSVVLTYCSVWFSTSLTAREHCSGEIPRDAHGRIARPHFPNNRLEKLMRADLNPEFSRKASMALRTALVCAACSLPYYIPSLAFLNELGFSLSYVVVILVFTVFMDIGTTLSYSWYNYLGTLLPVLNCLWMYGLYPNGSSDDGMYSHAWWFGLADFVVFILINLCFNWPVSVRMFGLSWQAYFSMCFLNPTDSTHFSSGIRNVVLEGAAVSPLVGTIIGNALAVVAFSLIPFGTTVSTLNEAQKMALRLAWEEGRQWRLMIKFYSGRTKGVVLDKIIGEAHTMHEHLTQFKTLMGGNSWWECFDMGTPGRLRAHMLYLEETVTLMHDWLRGVLQALKTEDFSEEHAAMLEQIAPQLSDLSDHSSTLLFRAVRSALNGSVEPSEETLLRDDINAVKKAQADLCVAFTEARKKVFGKQRITPDSLGEHFFAYSLSTYGQASVEYAEYMLSGELRTPPVGLFQGLFEGTGAVFSWMNAAFYVRGSFAFFLAFAVGYRGLNGVLDSYTGTPAGTTAFLMASQGKGGSAILKNIARFQGTAGGTLLGQLIWGVAVTGNCFAGLAVAMVGLVFFSMFLCFSSPSFGYVGVLFAAYGGEHLMLDPGVNSVEDDQASVYGTIVQQFLAILAVTISDLVVGNVSSGTLAVEASCALTDTVEDAFRELVCVEEDEDDSLGGKKDIKDIKNHRALVQQYYATAVGHAAEAVLEPRWYRTAWRAELWENFARIIFVIADKVTIMEYILEEGEMARKALVESKSMDKACKVFLLRSREIVLLTQKLLVHESEAPFGMPKKVMQGLLQQQALDLRSDMDNILKEALENMPEVDIARGPMDMLTKRAGCQVAAVLMLFEGLMQNVNQLEQELFAAPELLLNRLQ